MKYGLVTRGQAKADVRRAAKWYERQRNGLGREFVAEVDVALARIQANPEQYEVRYRDIRHAILRRFPYGVFYRLHSSRSSYLRWFTSTGQTSIRRFEEMSNLGNGLTRR